VLVTSSAAAYGAFPDNPVPLTEDDPVHGVSAFSYARDKTEADRPCQLWAASYTHRTMTIVRPCVVFGPNVDNYLVRLWTRQLLAANLGTIETTSSSYTRTTWWRR
jgi:UDP-glucose 4-epimerase